MGAMMLYIIHVISMVVLLWVVIDETKQEKNHVTNGEFLLGVFLSLLPIVNMACIFVYLYDKAGKRSFMKQEVTWNKK